MESGNLKLKVSYNNIVTFVKELCEENFYPLLQSKNITLNFQTEQDVIMAYFDVDKLDKIIYNLLSNALKYNYQDGNGFYIPCHRWFRMIEDILCSR